MSSEQSLFARFEKALASRATTGDRRAVAPALAFVNKHRLDVEKVLKHFSPDGRLANGRTFPASAFNDFSKWTMLPVIRALERANQKAEKGEVRCTFSVSFEDAEDRRNLLLSVKGEAMPELFEEIRTSLQSLARRKFDRTVFERCVNDNSIPGWSWQIYDDICGPIYSKQESKLADEVIIEASRSVPSVPRDEKKVIVHLYIAYDSLIDADRVFIEASGPWSRVTWLESSLTQAVYDAMFRVRMRRRYSDDNDASWYPEWLADAYIRCARSAVHTSQVGLRCMLLAGKASGGLPFLFLQAMYLQFTLQKDGMAELQGQQSLVASLAMKSIEGPSSVVSSLPAASDPSSSSSSCPCCQRSELFLGTSSVTVHYWLLDAGVDEKLLPKLVASHTHELNMVLSATLGALDDQACMPLSQCVGHALYFLCSMPAGDVRQPARKALMPMLPATLCTPAFMATAGWLTVPRGPHTGEPLVSVMGVASHESGSLSEFAHFMRESGFKGALLASMIELPDDMLVARDSGYIIFGASGFFGDSERTWDKSAKDIHMNCEVVRVHLGSNRVQFSPVKTGDPVLDDAGNVITAKFETDGLLSKEEVEILRVRTKRLSEATSPKVEPASFQQIFEDTLMGILGPAQAADLEVLEATRRNGTCGLLVSHRRDSCGVINNCSIC